MKLFIGMAMASEEWEKNITSGLIWNKFLENVKDQLNLPSWFRISLMNM